MERRDLLKLGALASVSGSSCAALLNNPGAVSAGELGGFLGALDEAMKGVATGDFFKKYVGNAAASSDPELVERARKGEELTKKTMRSLLLVGTLSELPPEQLAHESVQERLRSSMGEFDEAMFGMSSLLENLSPTERADIGKALRDDPNLGMKLMGDVDQEAAAFGVSLKQRTKLRGAATQVTARLRNSTDLTVSEYVGKMNKIAARHGAISEFQREAATSMAQQMIWQDTGATGGGTTGQPTPPPPPPPQPDPMAGPVDPNAPPMPQAQPEKPRTRASLVVITAGGIALGLGLLVFGIGYATSNTGGILLGATFGILLGVAGLICLLVGLILLAAGK
ncbi:MAG: hypothetical protein QM817_28125 [Archangium sp.]